MYSINFTIVTFHIAASRKLSVKIYQTAPSMIAGDEGGFDEHWKRFEHGQVKSSVQLFNNWFISIQSQLQLLRPNVYLLYQNFLKLSY